MLNIKKQLFGTNSKKKLKKYKAILPKINALESKYANFDREACVKQTQEFKAQLQKNESLEDILPEAFALVRKAAFDVLGERHYDVQLLGGMALHDGQVAEMKTGEGKTLTSTLAVYLNALEGKGVHLVTVNDYLAARDAEWMGKVYDYLGMSVGLIKHESTDEERRDAYSRDITYATNSELGFDYLRDNMKYNVDRLVQRDFNFAIVDEVDSILIDEARTPLIISGPSDESTEKYAVINHSIKGLKRAYRIADNPDPAKITMEPEKTSGFQDLMPNLKDQQVVIPGDYILDEKTRNIQLTDQGVEVIEKRISKLLNGNGLFEAENMIYLHHVQQSLKAWYIFKREVDYLVQDGEVILVDEFTGRLMHGRRYSDGLHQALEAKEGLKIEKENQTLASITYQNYFRKYKTLAGMTGTAETEEDEFLKIYGLGVVIMPTNKPPGRKDYPDSIYKTKRIKNLAIISKISELYNKEQPVLVGTDSIEYSEEISSYLKKEKIPHRVLNAKFHSQEAEIISQAGQCKTVTIATNMAGRGTDIKLSEDARKTGGLYILGTVRHESRRVDNQLRGRSGRQGDFGESKFIISLEDDLLRVFGGGKISKVMTTLKLDENEAIEHSLISRAIENSQKMVESRNFSVRKHLLEYDDVMNKQREIIYERRKRILHKNFGDMLKEMIEEHMESLIDGYLPVGNEEDWDMEGLKREFQLGLGEVPEFMRKEMVEDGIQRKILDYVGEKFDEKNNEFDEYAVDVQQKILLDVTDTYWREHFLNMDILKESVGLSGYAQKNPLDEYKKGAFELFKEMHRKVISKCYEIFFKIVIRSETPSFTSKNLKNEKLKYNEPPTPERNTTNITKQKPIRAAEKIGRNQKCSCGSDKKYKNCCALKVKTE